jgi:hypothetical protein
MSPALDIKVEKITPAIARNILENFNSNNRKMRDKLVDKYARDMMSGRWDMTADPLRFNCDGSLLDGQHRLAAIVKSKKSIMMVVVRGVDKAARHNIDTGAKRSVSDTLTFLGYKNVTQLAATARWLMQYDRNQLLERPSYSNAEVLGWIEANPKVCDVVNHHSKYQHKPGTKTVLISIAYLTRKNFNHESAAFIETVRTGEGLFNGNPIYALRKWLEWNDARAGRMRSIIITQGIVVKAWNTYVDGGSCEQLHFRPGGPTGESFPAITTQTAPEPNDL